MMITCLVQFVDAGGSCHKAGVVHGNLGKIRWRQVVTVIVGDQDQVGFIGGFQLEGVNINPMSF